MTTNLETEARVLPGLQSSLQAAAAAGALVGCVFGLVDGLVAARVGTADLGPISFLGCLAAAALQYAIVWCVALCVAAIVLHPMLMKRSAGLRFLALVRIGLALGIFVELFWWTRTFVFYGRPAFSLERLASSIGLLAIALVLGYALARPLGLAVARFGSLVVVLILALWVGGAAFLLGQENVLADRGSINARNRDLPNVLLVVCDALRQDVLGCYGNARVKTPVIDKLAREGVLFENAFTQAPFTWTSFGSLLTGKYPRRHGLVGMDPTRRMSPNITLPFHLKSACFTPSSPHKGQCLRDGDYLGATFHTGTLSNGSRLLRGFDVYFEQMAGHGLVVQASPWSVFSSDLLLRLVASKLGQKAGYDVTGTAQHWLAEHADRRFVAMVHLYSTHTPYDPPVEFKRLYADPNYSGPVKSFYAQHREAIERGDAQPTPADVEAIRNLYYAGVSQADANIGKLVAELEHRGVLDDTLVIVTGDHGESLGESDALEGLPLWEHDHMAQTNLRIPLVMRLPRKLPAGARVNAITDEIDVVPTVCDLLGLELPHESDALDEHGRDRGKVDGASLLPLVRGTQGSVRELSFAENGFYFAAQDRRWKLVVPVDLLAEAEWKKGPGKYGGEPALFDLDKDPGEAHDALAEHESEALRLLAALRAWNESMPIPQSEIIHSPREIEENQRRLKALGYTEQGIGGGTNHPKKPKSN